MWFQDDLLSIKSFRQTSSSVDLHSISLMISLCVFCKMTICCLRFKVIFLLKLKWKQKCYIYQINQPIFDLRETGILSGISFLFIEHSYPHSSGICASIIWLMNSLSNAPYLLFGPHHKYVYALFTIKYFRPFQISWL